MFPGASTNREAKKSAGRHTDYIFGQIVVTTTAANSKMAAGDRGLTLTKWPNNQFRLRVILICGEIKMHVLKLQIYIYILILIGIKQM